jgi:hypothetical protein
MIAYLLSGNRAVDSIVTDGCAGLLTFLMAMIHVYMGRLGDESLDGINPIPALSTLIWPISG